MKKILSLVLALALVLGVMSFASADDAKIKLVVWSFTNELQKDLIEKYYAPNHPEIEFEFQIYPTDGNEYVSKVDNLLATDAAAAEAPDIFTLEAGFVKHYTDSDWTADLREVGFTDEELATAYPVMAQIGQDSRTGVQKGLSWQSTPGALFYRASLAEKYLGVTTPEEFQELVKDWDSFLDTAQKLKEASNGACKMITGSGDIWNAYQYNRSAGWVVDGKLNIDEELVDFEELCKVMEEDDLTQKSGAWNETWFGGMRGDLETLTYLLPTWGLHYTLKPHCCEGADTAANDEELAKMSEEKNGTFGDWRMVAGPVGYSWGGTWMGANAAKVALADDAKKAAIKDVIYFFTLNEDQLLQYAKDSGDFVGSSTAVEKYLAEGEHPNPFLGGQDHYAVFAQAAALARGDLLTKYDNDINGWWDTYVTTPYTKGEKSYDECIADFIAQVQANISAEEVAVD